MPPPLALVPLPAATPAVTGDARPSPRRTLALYGLATALLASIGLFPTLLPVVSIALIATCTISGFALSMSGARLGAVDAESIASHELRGAYYAVQLALVELERTAAEAPRLSASTRSVLERSRAAAASCGRMARLADSLQRYLDQHDPAHLQWELERLRARAAAARDGGTTAALSRAIAARERRLATHNRIAAQRDRIHARLELVAAAIESFTATLVKLRGADEEQLVLAGGSPLEHLDDIDDELAALEGVLEPDLAA